MALHVRAMSLHSLVPSAMASLLAALVCARDVAADHRADALRDDTDGRNWPAYGRTFSETHYSPLTEINDRTVARLGLAWSLDLHVSNSMTAPLEIDGTLYVAAGYSIVHAVDARSGRLLWRYDPHVGRAARERLRTGWGIRGLAYAQGRLFVGTQDGRLLALNAATGRRLWSVQTLDAAPCAGISGPPRAYNGKVVIGFAGGDFCPVRGYVTAYDAEHGARLWRFFVVPGKPGARDGAASDDVMEMAARTWTGEWWKYGGGGAVWNAMTYDPEFNRLYIGTGNGGPMNWKIRSPDGGDNLFVASVVALDADTGKYIWHYQTTPGDAWDYDSATDMTLATLDIDGRPRRVILHAAKNGFFYVIDRENGRLLSGRALGKVTWATGIDPQTGRPVEASNARYRDQDVLLWPSFEALHQWPPQSFSPITGLVYVPTVEMPSVYGDQGMDRAHWQPIPATPEFAGFPDGGGDVPVGAGYSLLKAWDPRAGRNVWQVQTRGISNGGTLATAGGLVFQGLADGYLHAYSATTGQDLWSFFAGVAVTGVPISYSVAGRQYLTVTSGPLNGATGAFGAISAQWGWDARIHPRRLLTFALDAHAVLPPTPAPHTTVPIAAPDFQIDPTEAKAGAHEYVRCTLCHGMAAVAGGNAPDLRASRVLLSHAAFAHVVREGALVDRGMPRFPELSDAQLDAIRHYVRSQASAASARPAE